MNTGLSYSTLNTYRSALNLINPPSPESKNIVKKFLKCVSNIQPPQSKYQATWNPQPVLNYLKGLYSAETLSLQLLFKKLFMLLAVTTGHRV